MVAKVHAILEGGNKLDIVDPTADKLYVRRKRKIEDTSLPVEPDENDEDTDDLVLPKSGWSKSLEHLPDFSDINIRAHASQSGKKVNRKPSITVNQVCSQTCTKPERRGYQFFVEGYLHEILTCYRDYAFFVKASCFRSQIKSEVHHLWCALSKNYPHDVLKAYCSCVAGASGFCNHVLSLLYQLSHFCKASMKVIPDEESKTNLPQVWDKPRIRGITADPLMACSVQKAKQEGKNSKPLRCSLYEARGSTFLSNDSLRLKHVQDNLTKEHPLYGITYMPAYMASQDTINTDYTKTHMGSLTPLGSVLSYQLARTEGNFDVSCDETLLDIFRCTLNCEVDNYPDLPLGITDVNTFYQVSVDAPDRVKAFISRMQLTRDQCVNLEKETRDQTANEQWWDARKYRLTASKFSEIIKRKAKNHDKYIDKFFTTPSEKVQNAPSLRHGRKYEAVAAEKYAKYMHNIGHNITVLPSGFVVRPELPFLGCTPDRKVLDPCSHPHFGLLEVKCPYTYHSVTPREAAVQDTNFQLTLANGKLHLKKNHAYYHQVQGQMALCGAMWCDFVVYTFKGMYIERIPFDNTFWNEMLTKLEAFYFTHFLPRILNKEDSLNSIM